MTHEKGLSFLLNQLDGYAPPEFENVTSAELRKLQLYRIMANQIPQRVFWKDLDLNYIWANRSFADDCGVDGPDDLVGKNDFDMPWTEAQALSFRTDDQHVLATKKPKINIIETQMRSDGSLAWLHTNKVPVFDKAGDVIGLIGTYEDITERAQGEIAVRRYQQMVESIFNHAPVGIFWKDRDYRFLGCNAHFAADAGLDSPADIVGKTDDDLSWTPQQAEMFRAVDLEVMETGQPKLGLSESIRRPNGDTAWLQVNKVPLQDEDGSVVGVLGTYLNVTKQVETREALKQARAATQEERQRLARDLHDAVSQTLWTASLLADVLPSTWDNDREEGERTIQQLQKLTRGALAEMRMLLLELRPSSLAEATLRELLERIAEATMSRKKLEILVTADMTPNISYDTKIALYRITQEALNNVARHSKGTQAVITLRNVGNGIDLTIKDNGRGFDLESKKYDGMGLSIMQERAESIGATLKISSAVSQGTTITLRWRSPK